MLEQPKVIVFGLLVLMEDFVLKKHVIMPQLLILLMQIVNHIYLLVLLLELVDVLRKRLVRIIRLQNNVQMVLPVSGMLDNH